MSKYARVLDGLVQEFFETDGDITQMFPPSLIWVNVDAWPAVEIGWIAENIDDAWSFRPWAISPEEILRINTLDKAYRRSLAIDPMAMALVGSKLCYYDETGTTPVAKAWQEWYAAWDAVDLTIENPVWPTPPNAVQP